MTKSNLNLPVIAAVLVTMFLMAGINAAAYKIDDAPAEKIVTDLSDRSLIKEVILNQKQMLSLLNEIKGACKAK